MDDFVAKVFKTICDYNLIRVGEQVTIGLSGGADSVCLLIVLDELSRTHPFSLKACHVHHGIRGEEADKDASFAEHLCRKRNIPFVLKKTDAVSVSHEKHMSLEAAARLERYRLLHEAAEGGIIAIAHNRNDRAETFLLNLIRGSGGGGLGSIRMKNENIIRPLLDTDREEIEKYLRQHGIDWQTDATNKEEQYRRNALRHTVIPMLKKFNPEIVKALNHTADCLREDDDYLTAIAQSELGEELSASKLLSLPKPIAARMALLAWRRAGEYDLTQKAIDGLIKLASCSSGRRFMLGNTIAEKNYDTIVFLKKDEERSYSYSIDFSSDVYIKEAGLVLRIGKGTAFDKDRIGDSVTLRSPQPGDRFVPEGMNGHKKIKDFLADKKIPKGERDIVPLLVTKNGEIAWVAPYRRGAGFAPDKNAKHIIKLTIEKENDKNGNA